MCGIVGYVGKTQNGFFASDTKAFEELLYIDALRGPDSTGLACYYNDGEMQLVKDSTEAAWFRCSKEYEDAMKRLIKNGKAVIGHNRKKTSGKIDDVSAHPFAIAGPDGPARYLFVHNGTLYNETTLEKELDKEVVLESDVDSEILGNLLCPLSENVAGLEEALGKVMGAYACVWIDQKTEKLYMLRNKERPLFLATTTAGYYWASEPGFLYAALTRNKLKVDTCEQIDEDTLYSIDMSGSALTLTKEKLTIKKALPVSTKGTGKTHGRGATNNAHMFPEGKVSKNRFKQFTKKWLGAIGSFYIDDYVERNLDRDWKGGWLVWGEEENNYYEIPHQCRGYMSAMPEAQFVACYAGEQMYGRIANITRDDATGMPIMMMENISQTRNGVILKEKMENNYAFDH